MALDRIQIQGGEPLRGEINISGSKNAALPLLALTLLTPKPCLLHQIPKLKDIETMISILQSLGVEFQPSDSSLQIQAKEIKRTEAPYDFVRKMRASVLLLGPLLARCGMARVSMPGGCAIGVRPINLHLEALRSFGATIELTEGYVEARAKKLRGTKYGFPSITVTGTMNVLMAASLAKGQSLLTNCAQEPEVVSLCQALIQAGVPIQGIGTSQLEIEGRDEIQGFQTSIIPDRIEAGTYLIAGAITQGELWLRNAPIRDLQNVIQPLRTIGISISEQGTGLLVKGQKPFYPIEIETREFPGFPTDMQAQMMVLLALAQGTSFIVENIFENRFTHIPELIRMGAQLSVKGSKVTIHGVSTLKGAPVMASDLRASACLVLAGLAAEGTTEILRIYHLDRGYEKMEEKLTQVGGKIVRIHETS